MARDRSSIYAPPAGVTVLDGPPGSGKSTTASQLRASGHAVIDLELLRPAERAVWELPSVDAAAGESLVVAAADQGSRLATSADHYVVILPAQDVYDTRRAARDRKHPSKRDQPFHDVEVWRANLPANAVVVADALAEFFTNSET